MVKTTDIYRKVLKRSFDLSAAIIALIITFPLWIIVSMALGIQNKGKIFFCQPRIGKKGKVFRIIKFRSMTEKKDKNGKLLADHLRLTPIGKWVRLLSLDELPQFLNIIKGDMSFIGPRPLLTEYMTLYSENQRRRHDVTPGITGWAQCHGRNAITWQEKFDYDLWYVDNLKFSIDVKIILMTIKTIFEFNLYNSQEKEVEKFNGHN